MNLEFFIRGLLIGLPIAATVGPMWLLVMRRTLALGRVAGLVSGLGIATADGLYGAVGGYGLTLITNLLVTNSLWLRLAGVGFMCYLGIKTALTPPSSEAARDEGRGLVGLYTSTFLLTMTNPMTILSFAVILAGMGSGSESGNYLATTILIAGIFCGSALWWLVMTGGLGLLHKKVTPVMLLWVNRISGSIILIFGLVSLLFLLFGNT